MTKSRGYILTLLAATIFAAQDGVSKYLGTHYPPIFITMIRYWVFTAFVIFLAMRSGGILKVAATTRPFLQLFRGALLATEIVIFIYGLTLVGLAMAQSIIQIAPLLITMLSVPFLGEKIGWRRWSAIVAGFLGVLLIINPTGASFDLNLLLPLTAAAMFSIYSVATRAVSKTDSSVTSLFYTAVGGVLVLTVAGLFQMVPIAPKDWIWVAALCACGISSHFCLIKAYEVLEASEVQPLTYLQLVFGAFIATFIFHETLTWNIILGAIIVVGAGLFSIFRQRVVAQKQSSS